MPGFLSITNSQSLLKLMSIESVMSSYHLSLCSPFSSPLQFFPASGSLAMSQFFASGSGNNGVSVSAAVLPMNIQDCFPLGWTGWIFLQSKGLSRVCSNTTVQKHQFFSTQLSSQSNYHIHFQFSLVQFSSVAQLCPTLRPHESQYARPPCDSILKSRDITLPTKFCLVKAMVFPVVMYGCESWTVKKTEH